MKKALVDLDGVLVDLHLGIIQQFAIKQSVIDAFPRPLPWDWPTIALGFNVWGSLDVDFWETLPWTIEGRQILYLIENCFGEDICILTNPLIYEAVAVGKMRWLAKHLPKHKYLIGQPKDFCSCANSLLIDDNEENINAFKKRKGHGILIPRLWNKLHGMDPISTLAIGLQRWAF